MPSSCQGFPLQWNGKVRFRHVTRGSSDPTEPHFLSGFLLNLVSHAPPGCSGIMSPSTCKMSRLPEIIYWLSSISTMELSEKSDRESQDSHSYGCWRQEALVLLVLSLGPWPVARRS